MAGPDSTIIVNIEKGPKKEGRQFASTKEISGLNESVSYSEQDSDTSYWPSNIKGSHRKYFIVFIARRKELSKSWEVWDRWVCHPHNFLFLNGYYLVVL